MGLFDFLKRKPTAPAAEQPLPANAPPPTEFDQYYLYGFTDGNPNQVSSDEAAFTRLYYLVIGSRSGICVSNSYHPYYTVNTKGTSVWVAAYFRLYLDENASDHFDRLTKGSSVYIMDISSAFQQENPWPDTRLNPAENPVFGQRIPFIIPFVVLKDGDAPDYFQHRDQCVKTNGDDSAWRAEVTEAVRFLLPGNTEVAGFAQFDDVRYTTLIDHFMVAAGLSQD